MNFHLASVPELIDKHRTTNSKRKKHRIEEELNKREQLTPHSSGSTYVPVHDWHLNPPAPK